MYLWILSRSITYRMRSGIDVLSMLASDTWNPTSRLGNPISSEPMEETLSEPFSSTLTARSTAPHSDDSILPAV
jgi:hypothetical protein